MTTRTAHFRLFNITKTYSDGRVQKQDFEKPQPIDPSKRVTQVIPKRFQGQRPPETHGGISKET